MSIWCIGLGLVLLVAELIGGNTTDGAVLLGIMVFAAALFALAERSEALRGIGGSDGDERFEGIEVSSMAAAGRVMAIAVVAAWVYELTQGSDGAQYSWILALGSVAYLGTMSWLRRRC